MAVALNATELLRWKYRRHIEIDTQSLTFSLAVPEGHRPFILGHETSSAGEAEDPAWLWLVGAQRTGLARAEAVSREVTSWTLT